MKQNDKAAAASKPQTVYRKDYQRPDYLVDDVTLEFDIGDDVTNCKSTINVRSDYDRDGGVKPMFLDGDELELKSIKLDGKPLTEKDYTLDEKGLTIANPPKDFQLEIETDLKPKENTKLQGLYESDGVLCTKCETEGFRRITFFPDRPDVMAEYTTIIKADKDKLPVLLSNGNPVEKGETEDGRHFAKWHDPHPKPSYLYALVAGDLDHVQDNFKNMSGKDVSLNVWVEKGKGDKAGFALDSLKNAMRWDEEKYNREYDLDQFSIVAVSNFNSGACENTSLNIFNDKYVLADPKIATDNDYEGIEGVVGHEFFHNWSGNRVTLANWFNLSLKEGLTVYRDQEFSSDMRSRPVKRIEDASALRAGQFGEDSGPMAHPVRPDSYISVRNVYTGTVYNKGAEVIRMQEKVMGKEPFRKGLIHYFDKHAGQAVTCDDFISALEESSSKDLSQFRESWYSQAGTPKVTAKGEYDPETKSYTLKLKQNTAPTPGQATKKPFVIPLEVGLMDKDGNDMPLQLAGEKGAKGTSRVLVLNEGEQTFKFENVKEPPVLSANRGFTSPITMDVNYSTKERALLMAKDTDLFNRWDAGQEYGTKVMLDMVKDVQAGKEPKPDMNYVKALGSYLKEDGLDPAFIAKALVLPGEKSVASKMDEVDVQAVHTARKVLGKTIAETLKDDLYKTFETNKTTGEYTPDPESVGKRAVKNAALTYIAKLDEPKAKKLVLDQYKSGENMTDVDKAFTLVAHSEWPEREGVMEDFYQSHKKESLVVDKWLRLQAQSPAKDTLDTVKKLMDHEGFKFTNPNKARALIGGFASNQLRFHEADGSGYKFLADQVVELDKINPQIAANLLKPLGMFKSHEPKRQAMMQKELKRILDTKGISPNTFEVATKAIDSAKKDKARKKADCLKTKANLHKTTRNGVNRKVSEFGKKGGVKLMVSGAKGNNKPAHKSIEKSVGKVKVSKAPAGKKQLDVSKLKATKSR